MIMKSKKTVIILSVLLIFSIVYGVIATVAVMQSRNNIAITQDEPNDVKIMAYQQVEILSPVHSAMREIGMTDYVSRKIVLNGDYYGVGTSADIIFTFKSSKIVKAEVVTDGNEWSLVSLSDDNGTYYWLDERVAHLAEITKWEE